MEKHRLPWDTYTNAWNEPDHAARMQLLAQSVSPDCVYTDPLMQVSGYDGLSGYMGESHKQYTGMNFETLSFMTHHDQCLIAWNMKDGQGNVITPGNSFRTGRHRWQTGYDDRLLQSAGISRFTTAPAEFAGAKYHSSEQTPTAPAQRDGAA